MSRSQHALDDAAVRAVGAELIGAFQPQPIDHLAAVSGDYVEQIKSDDCREATATHLELVARAYVPE